MSETTNLEHKQEASGRFGRKVVGRSSAGPLRDHIVWVWDPQGCLFTSTHREGWENAGGDAEGGLLLGITSPMNIFSSILDQLRRKKNKSMSAICTSFHLCKVYHDRMTSEFERARCQADRFDFRKVRYQAKEHYRLR